MVADLEPERLVLVAVAELVDGEDDLVPDGPGGVVDVLGLVADRLVKGCERGIGVSVTNRQVAAQLTSWSLPTIAMFSSSYLALKIIS